MKVPIISEHLVEYLQKAYPDRCPDIDDEDREIWFHCGAVSVVKHLQRLLTEQEKKNILDNSVNEPTVFNLNKKVKK